jgi:hypothetical protein
LPFQKKYIETTQTIVWRVLFYVGEIKEIPTKDVIVKLWKQLKLKWLKDASKHENELPLHNDMVSIFF